MFKGQIHSETHQTCFVGGMSKLYLTHTHGQVIKKEGRGIFIIPDMGTGTIA